MHKSGNSYLYLVNTKVLQKWKKYKAILKGILPNGFDSTSFKPGTKYFRVLCFITGDKNSSALIKDVQIKEKHSEIIKTKI
jgi:hypothetical protein